MDRGLLGSENKAPFYPSYPVLWSCDPVPGACGETAMMTSDERAYTMVSLRYREVFPHMMVGVPGWIANNSMTEFARYQGSFRSTTINGPITGLGLNLGLMRIISVLEGWSRCTMAIIFPNSIFSDGARTASPYLFSTSGLRFCRSAGR
jgi:hypothetical protein